MFKIYFDIAGVFLLIKLFQTWVYPIIKGYPNYFEFRKNKLNKLLSIEVPEGSMMKRYQDLVLKPEYDNIIKVYENYRKKGLSNFSTYIIDFIGSLFSSLIWPYSIIRNLISMNMSSKIEKY
jgi:hypothetical protein